MADGRAVLGAELRNLSNDYRAGGRYSNHPNALFGYYACGWLADNVSLAGRCVAPWSRENHQAGVILWADSPRHDPRLDARGAGDVPPRTGGADARADPGAVPPRAPVSLISLFSPVSPAWTRWMWMWFRVRHTRAQSEGGETQRDSDHGFGHDFLRFHGHGIVSRFEDDGRSSVRGADRIYMDATPCLPALGRGSPTARRTEGYFRARGSRCHTDGGGVIEGDIGPCLVWAHSR